MLIQRIRVPSSQVTSRMFISTHIVPKSINQRSVNSLTTCFPCALYIVVLRGAELNDLPYLFGPLRIRARITLDTINTCLPKTICYNYLNRYYKLPHFSYYNLSYPTHYKTLFHFISLLIYYNLITVCRVYYNLFRNKPLYT